MANQDKRYATCDMRRHAHAHAHSHSQAIGILGLYGTDVRRSAFVKRAFGTRLQSYTLCFGFDTERGCLSLKLGLLYIQTRFIVRCALLATSKIQLATNTNASHNNCDLICIPCNVK